MFWFFETQTNPLQVDQNQQKMYSILHRFSFQGIYTMFEFLFSATLKFIPTKLLYCNIVLCTFNSYFYITHCIGSIIN